MIKKILELLKINTCKHPNVQTNKILTYCPDCGKLIHINWYIIRCSCCGKKRIGFIRGNKITPIAKYCTNCGTEQYYVEKITNLSYFDINYAVVKKEEELTTQKPELTESWVDEVEVLKNLKFLPSHLN